MKRLLIPYILAVTLLVVPHTWATNGDNLIGVGPVSRAMGGVGVASPQDSISAIFANPAAMNACPCGVSSEAVFGATLFDPSVDAKIAGPTGSFSPNSQHDAFVIPAVGVNMPINEDWRFGIGAYGISGLGVDYRNKMIDLDGNPSNGYEGDLYSRFEVMKFSPMLSYKVTEDLSVGAAFQAAYNNLDLGEGGTHDYTYGGQFGVVYNLGAVQLGASYTMPQKATFDRVFNFDAFMGDTKLDSLDLEAPQSVVFGVAFEPHKKLLTEVDVKWYDWSGADGYSDFDWDDQWVVAVGAQYEVTDELVVRAGYNYGENPVKEHNGWDPQGAQTIQGKAIPTLGYELFRVVGFPAVVEHHMTLGAGYKLTENMSMNVDWMHAFEKTISEKSAGNAFEIESSLSEDSIGFSLAWQFE